MKKSINLVPNLTKNEVCYYVVPLPILRCIGVTRPKSGCQARPQHPYMSEGSLTAAYMKAVVKWEPITNKLQMRWEPIINKHFDFIFVQISYFQRLFREKDPCVIHLRASFSCVEWNEIEFFAKIENEKSDCNVYLFFAFFYRPKHSKNVNLNKMAA